MQRRPKAVQLMLSRIRKHVVVFLLLTGITGCTSTGVVPMGNNLYTISKTSTACGFRDAGGVKADLFQEIGEFCAKKDLHPEAVAIEALDGIVGRRCASATIEFRCVSSSASTSTEPTGQRPDRDMNRDPTVPADRGQFGRRSDQPVEVRTETTLRQERNKYDDLEALQGLLDAGTITRAEFDSEKAKILAR